MNPKRPAYNERSWAIDLIGHIKQLSKTTNRPIKDVGGEQTIHTEGGALFPDVLLFGDTSTARILQGWELKMPDTSITDSEFWGNAESKARALGLDSFLLWNVSYAQLYVRNLDTNSFFLKHQWSDLSDVTVRTSVMPNRRRWEALATDIIGYLNDLFDSGSLEGRQFIEAYRSGGITSLIMENTGLVEQALKDAANRDAQFRAEMTLWWARYQTEYTGTTMELALAQAMIANWIGKILFAHILRETDSRALRVVDIQDGTTPEYALELFRRLSEDCDFWHIFSDSLGLSLLPEKPWHHLKQFNRLLTDLRVGSIAQGQLGDLLEATVDVARRKLRGQYPTPPPLAHLLVTLCMRNILTDRLLDPCCGTGTIARAALEQKLNAGVTAADASASVFAGDHDPHAVQIATLAVAKPSLMNTTFRIFQRDAFALNPTTTIAFRNPLDGTPFCEALREFDAITCNLPFVSQAGRRPYAPAIRDVTQVLQTDGAGLSGRTDIAAYLPFSLHPLLTNRGRLGVIITNAWLGTDWGDSFYESLSRYYNLKCVITSGAGRWFNRSDVVTNILIMDKRREVDQSDTDVKFVVLKQPLEELEDEETQRLVAAQIELGRPYCDTMTIRAVSQDNLARFRRYGLGGNAQFVNSDWVLALPLAPLNELFMIRRGERRGNNSLFYPSGDHGIEAEYIRPLAKSPTQFTRLTSVAANEAFSCSRTEEELRELEHVGALTWIDRFKTTENQEKLARNNTLWYQMKADSLTELVMFINYGDRLFVGRLSPPAFVDQRLVRLLPRARTDIGLCHALLNSSIGMFIIEGLGFGRGLGALDLNKDRIEAYMSMLDPRLLEQGQIAEIRDAFKPLLNRNILSVADELEQRDRQHFDETVLGAFGLGVSREQIYDSLRSLVEIRSTAKD